MWLIRCIFYGTLTSMVACAFHRPGPITDSLSAKLPCHTEYTENDTLMLKGRFAVDYEDINYQTKHIYGHFSWIETKEGLALALNNPLGQTLAIVSVPRAFFLQVPMVESGLMTEPASIEWPDHVQKTANDPEWLMQETLGFSVPLRSLRQALLQMMSSEPFEVIKEKGWIVERIPQTRFSNSKRFNLKHPLRPTVRVKLTIY